MIGHTVNLINTTTIIFNTTTIKKTLKAAAIKDCFDHYYGEEPEEPVKPKKEKSKGISFPETTVFTKGHSTREREERARIYESILEKSSESKKFTGDLSKYIDIGPKRGGKRRGKAAPKKL
jgi:hypothetical protein